MSGKNPLADRIRPKTLDDIAGQGHILGPGKPLRKIIESGISTNLVLYGPPGVGKTTVARIIAENTHKKMVKLNGTSASTADIREVIAGTGSLDGLEGVLLYLDEIQYLNKKQQQSLLEYMEDGRITLVASTTENPYFAIYGAILSRAAVFEFRPVPPLEAVPAVERAFRLMGEEYGIRFHLEEGAAEHIARTSGGDVRKCVNTAELCALSAGLAEEEAVITLENAKSLSQRGGTRYDRDGDQHYDLLSALQKSIRGSDENAALHYLARLLEAGDLLSPCRRLLVIASEDIGLAYPMAAVIVKACVDSALQLGLPEARIPLAEAVVLLSTSPKSNSAYLAVNAAMEDIRAGLTGGFPRRLQNVHADGDDIPESQKGQFYQYPHDFPHHYVKQQYLPDCLAGKVYYQFGDNRTEQAALAYRKSVIGEK